MRLTHAIRCRNQGLSFTKRRDADVLARNATLDQFFRHCFGAPARQDQIILRRAGAIRMARQFNPRGLRAGGFRSLTNDLARTRGQIGAVPVKKHQKAPRGDGGREGGTPTKKEEFEAEAEVGIAAAGFDTAQGVSEAEEGFARAAGEADGGATAVGEVETGGEFGGIARHGAATREGSVQATTHEVSEAVGNDAGIATARLELGEDREPGGGVGIEDGAGEALNAIGAWEAEELFDVGRLQRVDP